MRSLLTIMTMPLLAINGTSACTSSSDTRDELADQVSQDDVAEGQTEATVETGYAYFKITADLRKCPSPMCGGSFVSRLNRWTTRCLDGSYRAACYTPTLDWSEANLSEEQQAELIDASYKSATSPGVYGIVRGRLAATPCTTPIPESTRFVITEAWVAQSDAVSDGVFVQVKDNGRRCVVAPCETMTETAVNTPLSADIAGMDFVPGELTDDQIDRCVAATFDPDGLLMAGHRYWVNENGITARGRTATAAYYRLGGCQDPDLTACP